MKAKIILAILIINYGFLLSSSSGLNFNKLGDSTISKSSSDVFFNDLDNNGNGHISVDEIREVYLLFHS
jgi:hypothetical protein